MIKLSIFTLLLTVPLLSGTPLLGLPLWAWGSLIMTLCFAVALIVIIEKGWSRVKNAEKPDG